MIPITDFERARMKSQMVNIWLTLASAFVVFLLTHRRELYVPMIGSAWMVSILLFPLGPIPLWRLALAAVVNGALFYVLGRFFLP